MRHQGRITSWKDDKGFGFITPNGGGAQVFLHISALQARGERPAEGDLVTYELTQDDRGRPQARNVAPVSNPATRAARAPARHHTPRDRKRVPILSTAASVVFLALLGWFGWTKFNDAVRTRSGAVAVPTSAPATETQEPFRCTGKVYCSEMTSCAEAKFYLRNCPGVKIDGDGDGVPCEQQHCGS